MDLVSLIISLVSGAAGGNIAGALLKEKSLGALGNSIAGIFGGGIGKAILQALGVLGVAGMAGSPEAAAAAPDMAHLDWAQILGNIGGSGVGGGLLTWLVSAIKTALYKP